MTTVDLAPAGPDPLPADLAAALVAAASRLGPFGHTVLFYESTGSTNDLAAARVAAGPCEGLVIVAGTQTAGRGRRGRQWFSPPVGGLYVSVVLTPSRARADPARATAILTLAAGVAIAEGIDAAAGIAAGLKWPNDLQIDGRKVAGILADGFPGREGGQGIETVVLGFGINVGPMRHPPELEAIATSLERELGRPIDRWTVLADTLCALARRYQQLLAGSPGNFDAILDAWRARARGAEGRRVSWIGSAGRRSGTTAGIDDHGALLVHTLAGVERIVSGEVEWV